MYFSFCSRTFGNAISTSLSLVLLFIRFRFISFFNSKFHPGFQRWCFFFFSWIWITNPSGWLVTNEADSVRVTRRLHIFFYRDKQILFFILLLFFLVVVTSAVFHIYLQFEVPSRKFGKYDKEGRKGGRILSSSQTKTELEYIIFLIKSIYSSRQL